VKFSNDQQLREEDAELFFYSDTGWERKHVRAAEDLIRDLKGHGYLKNVAHGFLDASQAATVTLRFSATDGALTVPAGTRVSVADTSAKGYAHGIVTFETDEELVVLDGEEGDVTATALSSGEVFNVAPGTLTFCGSLSVTNLDEATGGVDHQLTRAAVYRAMELIHADLMRNLEDAHDAKRKFYRQSYQDELRRIVAAGLDVDADGDGTGEELLKHGFHRFERG
jgi:hypothetical protein